MIRKGGPGEPIPHVRGDAVSGRLATDQGYVVKLPSFSLDAANAWLFTSDLDTPFPLFVEEYVMNFVLAGSTGQSQMVRTFYPRNFQQTAVTINGQCPNQAYYNRLGEFVRSMQRKSVTTAQPGRIEVPTGGMNVPNLRGLNRGFSAEGYVLHVERGGEFGQFAPSYSFDFTISRMLSGLYHEDPVTIRSLKSWTDIIKSLDTPNSGTSFVVDPDVKIPDVSGLIAGALGAATLGGK